MGENLENQTGAVAPTWPPPSATHTPFSFLTFSSFAFSHVFTDPNTSLSQCHGVVVEEAEAAVLLLRKPHPHRKILL